MLNWAVVGALDDMSIKSDVFISALREHWNLAILLWQFLRKV